MATVFTRGDTPLGRDLRKHGLRGLWSAYRDAQESSVFLKTQVSQLGAKVEELQAQLDEQDKKSLSGSWPDADDTHAAKDDSAAAAAKAEIDRLKSELHAAARELANEKTRCLQIREEASAESAALRERIARLEAQRAFAQPVPRPVHPFRRKLTAYEPAAPSTPRSESAASNAQTRMIIDRLTKTVEELNKQNAVLRNENSS